MIEPRIKKGFLEALGTSTIALSYSTSILFFTDLLLLTTFPELKIIAFDTLRYFLYFIFSLTSYIQFFPVIKWAIIKEEFNNPSFDWKISIPSLFIIGGYYSSLIVYPSEVILILVNKNISFEEILIRLICAAPSTILSMSIFETIFFHRYFREIFINMLRIN